ncbi:hypothetical protein P9112_002850 [Eukaryota sp. TZLM1-RC]
MQPLREDTATSETFETTKRYKSGSLMPGGARAGRNAAQLDPDTGLATSFEPGEYSGVLHFGPGEELPKDMGGRAGPKGVDLEYTTHKVLWGSVEDSKVDIIPKTQ